MSRVPRLLTNAAALLAAATMFASAAACGDAPQSRHLLIVVDGLRPDYVSRERTPNLQAFGERGVVFTNHHSVYPTVTRVNASSISTGTYPSGHGLMGNSVFFPRVDPARFLDTGNRDNLLQVEKTEGGRLLTAQTLGGILQEAGHRVLVVSSGSTGSSFLLNHTVAGGAILHPEYSLPEPLLADVSEVLGEPPAEDAPGGRDRWAIDAFLRFGLDRIDPTVTLMWLSDLDGTAHEHGIGDPATVDVLGRVDREIGRIQTALQEADRLDEYTIWVTSDHGFSTHTGAPDLAAVLGPYAGTLPDGTPRLVAGGGAIYVRDDASDAVSGIVRGLQQTAGVGAVFTAAREPGSLDGRVPGTLSFEAIEWRHDRAAGILFSPDWTDELNAHGFPGATASGGVAGHGSSSPYDIHNTLIAAGPALKRGAIFDSPSGNVDFAPTFLRLLGLPVPPSMQGRVLEEALAGGPDRSSLRVRTETHAAATSDGTYEVTARFSVIETAAGARRYLDRTTVRR